MDKQVNIMNVTMAFTTRSNSYAQHIAQRISHIAQETNEQCEQHFIQLLKSLSKQKKWIFITANTMMPSCDVLLQNGVELNRLIRLKASNNLTEQETINKAQQLGTASAIISNNNCYYFTDEQWLTLNRKLTILH